MGLTPLPTGPVLEACSAWPEAEQAHWSIVGVLVRWCHSSKVESASRSAAREVIPSLGKIW